MSSGTKSIITLGIIALVIIGGYILFGQPSQESSNSNTASVEEQNSGPTETATTTPETSNQTSNDTAAPTSDSNSGSSSSNSAPETAKATTISYNNGAFSPSSATLSIGESVQFVNNDASKSVNVASNPHPSHTNFSSLNVGTLLAGEKSTTITFNKAGTYGYHNHNDPSQTGTIIVK